MMRVTMAIDRQGSLEWFERNRRRSRDLFDRIVPDCIRSLQRGEPVPVRNPAATRPWQHVLEPLSGYLWLASALVRPALGSATRSAGTWTSPRSSSR